LKPAGFTVGDKETEMKRLATVLVLLALCGLAQPSASFSRVNQCREFCPGEACCSTSTGWVCC
jgi:hypothetical protein